MSCTTCSLTFTDGPKSGTSENYEGIWLVDENSIWVFFLQEPIEDWASLPILGTDSIFVAHMVVGWFSMTEGKYTSPRVTVEFYPEREARDVKDEVEDVLMGEDEEKAVGEKLLEEEIVEENVEEEIVEENVEDEEKAFEEEARAALVYFASFFDTLNSVSATILQICTSANEGRLMITKEGRCRLKFLNDTVDLISKLVSSQPRTIRFFQPFVFLLQNIGRRMKDILEMLGKIEISTATITDNFDIFELKLRGQLEEMKTLFPPNATSLVSPVSIISNKAARAVWLKSFGNVHYTTFDNLILMLNIEIIQTGGEKLSTDMKMYLRYLVNFPADDVITTYKFNQLVCLFGLDDFEKNFRRLAEKKGFCGLINRIQAYEILTMSSHPLPLLVRMSRTDPHFLAFSYKDAKGKISHRVNKDSHGQPIQVEKFIRDKFPHHTLVNMQLNLEKIFGENPSTRSLLEYASELSGYYH